MMEEFLKMMGELKDLIFKSKEDNSVFTEARQATVEQQLTDIEIAQIEDEQMLTDHDIAIMELQEG